MIVCKLDILCVNISEVGHSPISLLQNKHKAQTAELEALHASCSLVDNESKWVNAAKGCGDAAPINWKL